MYHLYTNSVFNNDNFARTEARVVNFNWTKEATRLLIHLRTTTESDFEDPNQKKSELWERISDALLAQGHNFPPNICDKKWRNLLVSFRRSHSNGTKGRLKRFPYTWEFYEDLLKYSTLKSEKHAVNGEGDAEDSREELSQEEGEGDCESEEFLEGGEELDEEEDMKMKETARMHTGQRRTRPLVTLVSTPVVYLSSDEEEEAQVSGVVSGEVMNGSGGVQEDPLSSPAGGELQGSPQVAATPSQEDIGEDDGEETDVISEEEGGPVGHPRRYSQRNRVIRIQSTPRSRMKTLPIPIRPMVVGTTDGDEGVFARPGQREVTTPTPSTSASTSTSTPTARVDVAETSRPQVVGNVNDAASMIRRLQSQRDGCGLGQGGLGNGGAGGNVHVMNDHEPPVDYAYLTNAHQLTVRFNMDVAESQRTRLYDKYVSTSEMKRDLEVKRHEEYLLIEGKKTAIMEQQLLLTQRQVELAEMDLAERRQEREERRKEREEARKHRELESQHWAKKREYMDLQMEGGKKSKK